MTETYYVLVEPIDVSKDKTDVYSSQTKTIIDRLTAINLGETFAYVCVFIGDDKIISNLKIDPDKTYCFPELSGHVLKTGDKLVVCCHNSPSHEDNPDMPSVSVNVRCSGREIT